ncbi:hypothetical protein KJ885_03780 [Patescibacteria group bacterium]|nr:hypothetical protein [Patescibacteria group bacterium]
MHFPQGQISKKLLKDALKRANWLLDALYTGCWVDIKEVKQRLREDALPEDRERNILTQLFFALKKLGLSDEDALKKLKIKQFPQGQITEDMLFNARHQAKILKAGLDIVNEGDPKESAGVRLPDTIANQELQILTLLFFGLRKLRASVMDALDIVLLLLCRP